MRLTSYSRLIVIFGLALGPTACSEQGSVSTSPVAPGALADTAAKPGGGPAGFKVTSTVANTGQIQSDGDGPYYSSKTLTSEVQAIGDWVLDSINPRGATRKLSFDFSAPVPGTVLAVPPPNGEYKFRLLAMCGNLTESWTLSESRPCPIRIGFDVGTDRYVLHMNKNFQTPNGPFPSTDNVTVTCTASSGTSCSKWSFTPSGANVAKLVRTDANGNIVSEVGDFYLSFSMEIAK